MVGLSAAIRLLLIRSAFALPCLPVLIWIGAKLTFPRYYLRNSSWVLVPFVLGGLTGALFARGFVDRSGFVSWILYIMMLLVCVSLSVGCALLLLLIIPLVPRLGLPTLFWDGAIAFTAGMVAMALSTVWRDS